VFAGGFIAVHAGEIPIKEMAEQLSGYLTNFEPIAELYRFWPDKRLQSEILDEIFGSVPKRPRKAIREEISRKRAVTVFEAYNAATY
jgi:hypothetical protein